MTLRLSKCKFAKPTVPFIGHQVGSGMREPLHNKIEAINNIPEPTCKKALRSFIGACSFYREYVQNFATLCLPLTELTKINCPNKFVFKDFERKAFLDLKNALSNSKQLRSPDVNLPFIIRCDSSDYAVGACLAQVDPSSGNEHPIAFASQKLSETQTRWATIEKEAYAVIFALKKFDYLVFGRKILLYSDHNPLSYLTTSLPKSAKLTRWALSLSRYDIKVFHVKGKDNIVADFLSRY